MFTVAEGLIGRDLDDGEKLWPCPDYTSDTWEVSCYIGKIKVECRAGHFILIDEWLVKKALGGLQAPIRECPWERLPVEYALEVFYVGRELPHRKYVRRGYCRFS